MKNFALLGAAGFVAERHIKAIKETGNQLLAACDKFDVMGRMDSYFPEAEFFPDFDSFDKYIKDRQNSWATPKIDYCSICTPNYLHYQHIDFALRNGMNAISEKPLVIYPTEVERLEELEKKTGFSIHGILQLRLHPIIIALREEYLTKPKDQIYDVDLTYITSRGKWYYKSWKGDVSKSGGVTANIGIHFFDMLSWIFGEVKESIVNIYEPHKASGILYLERARVRWFLSLDYDDLPAPVKAKGSRTYRLVSIAGKEIEFSEGFSNLHTEIYKDIIENGGYGIQEVKPSILLTDQIRNSTPIGITGDYHPLLNHGKDYPICS
jgi:UDP-N-acetyl-2-amino-2-deoxyglucuronate dehydrogenase